MTLKGIKVGEKYILLSDILNEAYSIAYRMIDEYNILIEYRNKANGRTRTYLVVSSIPLNEEIIYNAGILARKLYEIIRDRSPQPNIPLYSLIIVLANRIKGFSYRCKVKKTNCPVEIYRMVNDLVLKASVPSIIEQVYRVLKKYNLKTSLIVRKV